jgi:hypothetical protein
MTDPEAIREAFALGAACALGDDEEAPAALKERIAEAEYHVQQLTESRDRAERALDRLQAAADRVGHQAACLVDPCDCWMRDLAPLLNHDTAIPAPCLGCSEDGRPGQHARDCAYLAWLSTVIIPARSDAPECLGLCGEHHWLDRPESDTRECLICGVDG